MLPIQTELYVKLVSMANCASCGKQNYHSAKFCVGCGLPLAEKIQSSTSRKITNTPHWPLYFLIMAGVAFFVYYIKMKKYGRHDTQKVEVIPIPKPPTVVDNFPSLKSYDSLAAPAPTINDANSAASSTSHQPHSYLQQDGKLAFRSDCYVIVTGSYMEESYAASYVATMKKEGYRNAGYLWIPDYPSLSGKSLYATFIGPYQTYIECENSLRSMKTNSRFWYGIKVSNDPERVEIRIK